MLAEYPFKSNYFSVDDHRLHYIDEGQGPVLLLVHGNPTWSYYYRNIITEFSKTHRVVAIDHLGCGLSDKPQSYNYCLHNHIENLSRLIDHLNIERYSLVVHDWGGAIGMGAALKDISRLKRVCILNTAAFRSSRIPFRISICKLPFVGPFIVRAFNGFAWPATFMAVEKPLTKEVKHGYLAPYNTWNNRVAVAAFVRDIPLDSGHQSYSTLVKIEKGLPALNEHNIPLLILWGGKDFCFNDHFYQQWRRLFPKADYRYYHDGGHYILEDKKEEILRELSAFFQEDNR